MWVATTTSSSRWLRISIVPKLLLASWSTSLISHRQGVTERHPASEPDTVLVKVATSPTPRCLIMAAPSFHSDVR